MNQGRDLLLVLLLLAFGVAAGPRPPPSVGPPQVLADCPVRLEIAGAGVGCVDAARAEAAGVHAGDRLRLDGERILRERMAPARLAALALPVDLNRSSPDELASLDGIGPRLAARIVAARPFATVEDLGRVPGVGAGRLARLRPRLTVRLDE